MEICAMAAYQISNETINAQVIAIETDKDLELSKIKKEMQQNGHENIEFFLEQGIIFKGHRILIPRTLQAQILEELHHTHPGVTKMQKCALRYCYWKGIDRDIERKVRTCPACIQNQHDPAKAPLHHWEEPAENWQRIHIDYAGPFQGFYFLIVVDGKSKWAEVRILKEPPTSNTSIKLLSNVFATHGFPEVMVSDNATTFTSAQFRSYCRRNGIVQKLIAPGHPSTNGLAERFVQIVKRKLKTMTNDPIPMTQKIDEIMQRYRATPLANGKTPAEQYLRRRLRIKLDAIKPIAKMPLTEYHPRTRNLACETKVQARYVTNNRNMWKIGTVVRKLGRLHYVIKLDEGQEIKRHIDQLKEVGRQQKHVLISPEVEQEPPD